MGYLIVAVVSVVFNMLTVRVSPHASCADAQQEISTHPLCWYGAEQDGLRRASRGFVRVVA